MMEVKKESRGVKNSAVTNEELSAINAFTKRALGADEVYTFAVRLCDNEVDRDGERFPRATLEELAELFVGKSGIFDHEWSAKGQAARIYRTEVVEEEGACSRRGAMLSQGICLHAARRRERRADRRDRGRHQKRGERWVQCGALQVLCVRRGDGQMRPPKG